MKKVVLICFFFLNVTTFLHAQSKRNAIWINGATGWGNWATQFKTNNTIIQYKFGIINQLRNYEASHSNICDSNGRIVLVSDGYNILDSNNNIMDGGLKLAYPAFYLYNNKSSYSQASLFLPMENNIYYFINLNVTDTCLSTWSTPDRLDPDRLLYHKVDMNMNGGAGKVYERMQILDSTGSFEASAMMACRHANGKDWWLIKQGADTVYFHTYLITQDSVVIMPKQYFPNLPFEPNASGLIEDGQITFNHSGTKMAFVSRQKPSLYLFDFDRCTGKLSNAQAHLAPVGPAQDFNMRGVCFSRYDRFVYVAKVAYILQFDTYAPDSASAWYQVAEKDTLGAPFIGYNNLYIANNNRIYIGRDIPNGNTMSVINNPDGKGALCSWCPNCLRFDSVAFYANGIGVSQPPCMADYGLGAVSVPCEPLPIHQFENLAMSELVVYPNPATDRLHLLWDAALKSQTKLEVRNLFGQVLLTRTLPKGASNYELDISNLPSACYLVKVGNTVRRFAKE